MAALLLCLSAGLPAGSAGRQGGAAQQAGAGLVTDVLFTAVDKKGSAVTTLKKEDVRVLADGEPQEILRFERQRDLPLLLAVLIDVSNSQERVLPAAKSAAVTFVSAAMTLGLDRAAVVTFTNDATLEQELTGDLSAVRAAIERVQPSPPNVAYVSGAVIGKGGAPLPGSTALWDAVWTVSEEVLTRGRGPGRRAVVLITDGIDTGSRVKLDEAVERAVQSDVVVYSVGMGDGDYGGVDKGDLRKLSERTGGRAFFPGKQKDLLPAFEQILQQLQSQYVVSFATRHRPDGSFHKLRLEVVNPELRRQGVKLAHPEGFYAGNTSTAAPSR